MASNARELIFGLGSASQAEDVRVHWPRGKVEVYRHVPADRIMRITEGFAAKW